MAGREKILVDTYAIIADLTDQIPETARSYLEKIRLGMVQGIIHPLIVYELIYHWKKGRLPFRNYDELEEFTSIYFKIIDIDRKIAVEAGKIKVWGDDQLSNASLNNIRKRRLSVCDAFSIAIAKLYNIPIVTGDLDLTYVARRIGVRAIW